MWLSCRSYVVPTSKTLLLRNTPISKVCLLVSALSSAGVEPTVSGDGPLGGHGGERSEFAASNPGAFSIIQSLLAECTPPVEAVCLQVG